MAPSGASLELGDEDRTLGFQVGHDVGIVHDLPAYVDRGAEALERRARRCRWPARPRRKTSGGWPRACRGVRWPGPSARATCGRRVVTRAPAAGRRWRRWLPSPGTPRSPARLRWDGPAVGGPTRLTPMSQAMAPAAASASASSGESGEEEVTSGPGPDDEAQAPEIVRPPGRRREVGVVVSRRWSGARWPRRAFPAPARAPNGGRCPNRATGVPAANDPAGVSRWRTPVPADAGEHDAPADRLGLVALGRQHGEVSHDPTPARSDRAPSPGRPGGRGGS